MRGVTCGEQKPMQRTKRRRANKSILRDEKIEESSGNVFADLGLPNAEELLLKAELALMIRELIEQKRWDVVKTSRGSVFVNQRYLARQTSTPLSGRLTA